MQQNVRIFVAGHRGLVGSAIVKRLRAKGYANILVADRSDLDLRDGESVSRYISSEKPELVILAAAKVGGIQANDTYPADFLVENLQIQNNVILSSHKYGVDKLVFLGSSCIYPKHAQQPLKEEYLLTGPLEATNEAYAIAKIAGIKLCQALRKQYGFNAISLMPTNLYGPGDNFNLNNSHVLPAMIRKFHDAKYNGDDKVVVWGTGTPRREFLYVDDLADATIHLAATYHNDQIVNVGVGKDISIQELAGLVKGVVGFEGVIVNDTSKPDGTPRKLLDVGRLRDLGWQASTELRDGIELTYQWFIENQGCFRQ